MDEELSPQLLDLIPNEREWHHQHVNSSSRSEGGAAKKSSEERKLELSLAPPGAEEDWSLNHKTNAERDHSLLSLAYNFSHANSNKNGFQTHNNMSSAWASATTGYQHQNQQQGNNNKASSSFLQFPSSSPPPPPSSQPQSSSMPVMGKDASQACCIKVAELQSAEKKVFSSPSSANTAVPNTNTSQKRTAPGPVVGWPPIRSFRKNLASSSSSKPAPPETPQHHQPNKLLSGKKPVDSNYGKGMFVKINMDGVAIGRKVDLNAYDSYENLSTAVDELFRGLLAAQRDSSAGGVHNKQGEEKPITGLLDGSGEYTLVYEDNEGDRMLVGDVPWHMFVSTVKRLRVLKSTELPLVVSKTKIPLDSAMK